MDIEKLIEEITNEVIRYLEEEERIGVSLSSDDSSLIIPLSYGFITWKESSQKIRELMAKERFPSLLIGETKEKDVIEKEWGKDTVRLYPEDSFPTVSHELLRKTSLVLVPLFSTYSLARVSLFTPVTLQERIILDALQTGVKVIIARDEFCYSCPSRKSLGYDKASPSFNKKIKDYGQELSSYGVRFIELKDLISTVKFEMEPEEEPLIRPAGGKREVITNEDIILFASSGNKFMKVSPGAIITPLARDTAKEMGVEMKVAGS